MASDEKKGDAAPAERGRAAEPDGENGESGEPRSASRDLAEGLDLMFRAARKAMRSLDPTRAEDLGRRVMRSVESLDARRVQELGRKAVQHMDPRKIEEIAEDAGRELLGVVERVADRVESAVGGRRPRGTASEDAEGDGKKRVRVDQDEK